jgi:hypothetical protein
MSVARQFKFNRKPSIGEPSFVTNGLNSVPASARQSQSSASASEVLEQKCREGQKIVDALRSSSDSRTVQGTADRICACCQRENQFVAEDLHRADTGELYDGKGSLWACNSRICPFCVAKLARNNRRVARHVFDTEKVFVGEHWFFITLTQPDLALRGLDLLMNRSVMYEAHRKFYRSAFWSNSSHAVSRGSMKSEEFTIGDFDQYHYHIHNLAICKNRITSDKFYEIRREWTDALEFSFKKHGIAWNCPTGNKNFIPALFAFLYAKRPRVSLFLNAANELKFFGLAVVNVKKVYNKNKAILELCKYFTKNESWSKIPSEQLADIASIERFPRMFETFGVCKATANSLHPIRPEKTLTGEGNAANRHVTDDESASNDAYIYTKNLTVRNSESLNNYLPAPRKKRLSWRIRCRILPRCEWLKSLDEEILRCREYRMQQLRHKFAFATFQTLDGRTF